MERQGHWLQRGAARYARSRKAIRRRHVAAVGIIKNNTGRIFIRFILAKLLFLFFTCCPSKLDTEGGGRASNKWSLAWRGRNFSPSPAMEEQKEPNSGRDSTEEESMSLSPNLPSPPMILPHQGAQQAHRTTNFFIDNILRPDFGCRKEPSYRDRSQTPGRENVNPLGGRPPHTGSLCLDSNCSSDSTSSSPSSSSSSSSMSSSPSSKQNSSKQGEPASNGTGRYADSPSSIVVMSGSNGGSASITKESQPLLWPAWVYCTRYSDRPSSGKTLVVPELHRLGCYECWGTLLYDFFVFFHSVRNLCQPQSYSYKREFKLGILIAFL